MTLDEQIAELLAQAEPLRALPDEECEAAGLPGIVNRINALRAKQAKEAQQAFIADLMAAAAPVPAAAPVEAEKPRRGRPPKAAVEGADA